MDASHFDSLVRSMAAGLSRRRLLGRALLGLALSAAAELEPHEAAAGKNGKKKRKVTLCRAGQTVTVTKKARKRLLREGATVGACQASPSPPPRCTPDCDNRVCGGDGCGGSCGTCDTDEVCQSGQCRVECGIDEVVCFDECIPASCRNQCNEPCRAIGTSCCGPLTCRQAPSSSTVSCRP